MSDSCLLYKSVLALTNLFVFFFIQIILILTILHFADVDNLVCTLNDDVYLCGGRRQLATPRIAKCRDGIYT